MLHTFVIHSKELPTEVDKQNNQYLFYNKLHYIMPRGQSRKSLFNNKVGSLNIRVLCFLPELHADFI